MKSFLEITKQLEEATLDESDQMKRIHKEYQYHKSRPTADVLKTHKNLSNVRSQNYTAGEMGGKEGLISDIMHHAHGKQRMDAYHSMKPSERKSLDESFMKSHSMDMTGHGNAVAAHRVATEIAKDNGGKLEKVNSLHHNIDFGGGHTASIKTIDGGRKITTHVVHNHVYGFKEAVMQPNGTDKVGYDKGMDGNAQSPDNKAKKSKKYGDIKILNGEQEPAIKEENIDEISKEVVGKYLDKVTKDQIKKQGLQPNMYDKLPAKRQTGVDNAFKRLKEAVYVEESRGHNILATKLANMDRMKNVQIPTPAERRAELEKQKKEKEMKEAVDTVKKDASGKVTSWSHEGDWEKSSTKKQGSGKAANLAGRAMQRTKQLDKEVPARNSDGTPQSRMSKVRALAKQAMKNQMKEDIDRLFEKDDREYGYEGEMVMTQLKTLCRHAEHLMDMLEPDTDLPEWVQSKITLATDYMQTSHDYLMSEMNESLDEAAWGKDKMTNLRQAHDRHMEKALAANKAGEDEAVKTHQRKMQMIQGKMQKLKQNEEVELGEECEILLDEAAHTDVAGIRAKYKQNEDDNRHTENAAMLAKHFGSKSDQDKVAKAKAHRDKNRGYGSDPLSRYHSKMAHEVHSKLYHHIKEEVEELDELSKDTLKSYVNKSAQNARIQGMMQADYRSKAQHARNPGMKRSWDSMSDDARSKGWKRQDGIKTAVNKLTKEDTMLSYSEFMAQLAEGRMDDFKDKMAADREKRLNKMDYSKEKETAKNPVTKVKGHSYGAGEEEGEDDEGTTKTVKPASEKRGRGRPTGSKSGARV